MSLRLVWLALPALPLGVTALPRPSAASAARASASGKTWTGPGVQAGQEQDRQWFAQTPDGKRQFLVYHDFVAEAEFYVESDDGGKTWNQTPVLVNDLSQAMTPPGIAVGPTQG